MLCNNAPTPSTSWESLAQLESARAMLCIEQNQLHDNRSWIKTDGQELILEKSAEILEIDRKICMLKNSEMRNLKNDNEELRTKIEELERKLMISEMENCRLEKFEEKSWDFELEVTERIKKLEDEKISSYKKMLQMGQHIEKLENSAQTRELEIAAKNRKINLMDAYIKQLKDDSPNRIGGLVMDYDKLFHKNQHLEARIKELEQDQNNEELDRKKDEKIRQLMDMWMTESKKCDQLEFENRMLKGQLGRMDVWSDAPYKLEPRLSSTLKQSDEQEDSGFQH